jgi:hypothetical protein
MRRLRFFASFFVFPDKKFPYWNSFAFLIGNYFISLLVSDGIMHSSGDYAVCKNTRRSAFCPYPEISQVFFFYYGKQLFNLYHHIILKPGRKHPLLLRKQEKNLALPWTDSLDTGESSFKIKKHGRIQGALRHENPNGKPMPACKAGIGFSFLLHLNKRFYRKPVPPAVPHHEYIIIRIDRIISFITLDKVVGIPADFKPHGACVLWNSDAAERNYEAVRTPKTRRGITGHNFIGICHLLYGRI